MTVYALTSEDVAYLSAAPTAAARIVTMTKLVHDLEAGALSEGERGLATEILHCFAADAEATVREAVAWQINNSTLLTEDLAEQLARDVGAVAFPVLRHAEALGDEFLLRIVAESDAHKQLAIAGRRTVSAKVANAIVEVGNVVVVTRLLRNAGAAVPEPALHTAVDRFGGVRAVTEAIAARPDLSMALVERLIAFVSEEIRASLVTSHKLSPHLAAKLVERGREAATMLLLQPLVHELDDVDLVAHHLEANHRLTGSLLCRALCAGEFRLFVAGMSVRAGIAVEAVRLLAWDGGPLGLEALFRRARLPSALEVPVRIAIAVARELGYDGDDAGRATYQAEVIAEVFTECAEIDEREVDDLLLQLIDQAPADVVDRAMARAGLPLPVPPACRPVSGGRVVPAGG